MKINIKRSCDYGLEGSTGDLFEYGEFQFCFVNEKGWYMLIELSSGAGINKSLDDDLYTKEEALEIFKEKLQSKRTDEIKKAIADFKERYPELTYPVNEPVKH